jgi:hydrogenase expression/formation protein HypE
MNKPYAIKGVLFDFDGTLTQPGSLDFARIKQAIGCPAHMALLEFIETLPTLEKKKQAMAVLDRFEMEAARLSTPGTGAEALVEYLIGLNLPVGIITRNSRQSVACALKNFSTVTVDDFYPLISRDDPVKFKPDPQGVLLAAEKMGVPVENLLVVGDYIFDTQAGKRAGAITVLLDHQDGKDLTLAESDFTITGLDEVRTIVRSGLPLPLGKLPPDLLKTGLDQFQSNDFCLLIGPGVGEDTAAVDVAATEVMVLKSDPITFATDAVGMYAVVVNANDIVTSGARPRWFLTTLLFPCGATPASIRHVMLQIGRHCQALGITLCGGHTEITDAVTRPVVSGMMVGTVRKKDLIDKRHIAAGDMIIMTKAAGIEGTAIIAREFEDKLAQLGVSQAEIAAGKQFLFRIPILKEAQIAARGHEVSGMHDVTEGGVATALSELAEITGKKLMVEIDKILCRPLTQKFCRLLGIDPLGLIGSGSLLICCRHAAGQKLIGDLHAAGIDAAIIGEVLPKAGGVEAFRHKKPVDWPRFAADEITRLFGSHPLHVG